MLQKVISQLSPSQFEELHGELSLNRGEKFAKLLELYRDENAEDASLRDSIGAKQAAFYTLKSRLFDKVQQYLFRTSSDNRAELLKNVSSVPFLVYNTPRETAVSLLQHLETELKREDMPAELVSVYNGLKTLHLHTPQYYQYQQLYNKNVAYMLALDKAEELICLFTRELGEYLLSLSKEKIAVLRLYLRELNNLSRLYDSHRLKVNHIIANVTYAIFVDEKNEAPESEETIEELLQQLKTIIEEHPEHRNYRFLESVRLFLNFEYYHILGLRKNAQQSYEKLNNTLETFLLLEHSCLSTHFLLSKLIHESTHDTTGDPAVQELLFKPHPDDIFSSVNFYMYSAAVHFKKGKYAEAASCLNELLNAVSFKNFTFAEAHVKLFLVLNCLLADKTDQAEIILRSVTRKIASEGLAELFPAADAFAKFLKIALNDNSASKAKKNEAAYQAFLQLNKGENAILRFAPLSPSQLKKLSE